MKKKEVVRDYNFSDGRLVTIVNEKIAYMRRDAAEFDSYGIEANMVDALERQTTEFSDTRSEIKSHTFTSCNTDIILPCKVPSFT